MQSARSFGRHLLPLEGGDHGLRQRILEDTVHKIEEALPTQRFHALAQTNLTRWSKEAEAKNSIRRSKGCSVQVMPGDWGDVTHALTKEFGHTFACLNMANAYTPGGGYVEGAAAQEENMFRRTDCHFSLDHTQMDMGSRRYLPQFSSVLNAEAGRVYLDVTKPRVCIRGSEDRLEENLGYEMLPPEEIFSFFELRAAAQDLRSGARFQEAEMRKRIVAQFDTLCDKQVRHAVLSAFGCGAFMNPAEKVAEIYREELEKRLPHFDCIAFAVFDAGYGPDNFLPFSKRLARLTGN